MEQYQLKVEKDWFHTKDVFTSRMYQYEKQLIDEQVDNVVLPINAGNLIYVMLKRLEKGVEWEKQNALIHSYRNLMYKLSYVTVKMYANDKMHLYIEGEKSDVMWAVSFITQVFPEDPIDCRSDIDNGLFFDVKNGQYNSNSSEAVKANAPMPDIWGVNQMNVTVNSQGGRKNSLVYDAKFEPAPGQAFALPDGRIANYVRMDERFLKAEQSNGYMDAMDRHYISASVIKDFEDLKKQQVYINYNLYRMRYVAFMTKIHELERLMGGFEVSCYDILPIGERGLPYASKETLQRTNRLDCNSLKYSAENIKRNKDHMSDKERRNYVEEVGLSVLYRIDGYDIEYQTYKISGTDDSVLQQVRLQYCYGLYADFANIDSLRKLAFQAPVYRALCNDPEDTTQGISEFEKDRLRIFGRGYLDFVRFQIANVKNRRLQMLYQDAAKRLERVYFDTLPIDKSRGFLVANSLSNL